MGADGVGSGQVGVTDGQGISCIRRGGLGKVEQGTHHERDLLFARTAAAHSGQLHAGGWVLHYLQAVAGSGQHGGTPGGAHGDGRSVALHVDNALDGELIRLPLFDEGAHMLMNSQQTLALREPGGQGEGAVIQSPRGAEIAIDDREPRVADGGVYADNAHLCF